MRIGASLGIQTLSTVAMSPSSRRQRTSSEVFWRAWNSADWACWAWRAAAGGVGAGGAWAGRRTENARAARMQTKRRMDRRVPRQGGWGMVAPEAQPCPAAGSGLLDAGQDVVIPGELKRRAALGELTL